MKKFAIYGLAAFAALGFTACDDYEEPNPQPQTNPQSTVLNAADVKVENALTEGGEYSLEQLSNEGKNIVVAVVSNTLLPEGYTLQPVLEISANDFSTSAVVPASAEAVEDAEGTYNVLVNPDDLQGVFYNKISKSSKAKEISVRFLLNTVYDKQVATVGGLDNIYGPFNMTVLPFPAGMVIEQNYYVLGTINNWGVADAVKMQHSGKDLYDDPVFALYVETTSDWWWKIVPESTVAAGDWTDEDYSQFGVAENGDSAMAGLLVGKNEATPEPGAGNIKEAGAYVLVINMEESSYEFIPAADYLYTPGNSNGWNHGACQVLATEDHINFFGYASLNGEYKFTSTPGWDGINYGSTGVEGQLTNDGGAGNLNAAEGLYWANVDVVRLNYSLTPITTIGVIGDATPAGWDASTPLTPSADFLQWTGTVKFNATGEYKFRANDGWDINLGGNEFELVQNGSNMATPGAGEFEIVLDLSSVPYTATLTAK